MKYTRNLCLLTIAICFCSELLSQTMVDPLSNSLSNPLSNSRSFTPNNPPTIQESLDVFLIELSIQQNLSLNLLRESFEDFKTQTTAKQYVAPVGARAKKIGVLIKPMSSTQTDSLLVKSFGPNMKYF